MSHETWTWTILLALGAYHGINPGMGWLFSVAIGMQERSRGALAKSLLPIASGHALAIGAALLVAGLASVAIPLRQVRILVAAILIGFGLLRLVRHRHPRWVGMRVGFRDLTFWSFLMATAHGAGLMVLPLVLQMPGAGHHAHALQMGAFGVSTASLAVLLHTLSYLAVTGLIAFVVYQKVGLAILRKTWFNLDWIWAGALIASGCFTVLVPA